MSNFDLKKLVCTLSLEPNDGFWPDFMYCILDSKKKRIFLVFHFTSLKLIIFYCLRLSKPICLCMEVYFAAFSCHNAISRKKIADFCRKKPKSQNSSSLCQETNFQCDFAACEFSVM